MATKPSSTRKPSGSTSTPSTPSGSGGKGGSGLSGQIAQVKEKIEQEKLRQAENKLNAEQRKTPVLKQIDDIGVQIAETNRDTKQKSLEIAQVRGEKEGISLQSVQNDRNLAQELTSIKQQFNEEKINRERRRLYEFDMSEF